jgi:hypothetical protein
MVRHPDLPTDTVLRTDSLRVADPTSARLVRWPLVALVALSNFAVWEYSVMARNYGITMLVLFAFAAGYERWRHRGWVVGLWLLLLANTNVHSVLLAGALGLFSRPLARLRRDQPAG